MKRSQIPPLVYMSYNFRQKQAKIQSRHLVFRMNYPDMFLPLAHDDGMYLTTSGINGAITALQDHYGRGRGHLQVPFPQQVSFY